MEQNAGDVPGLQTLMRRSTEDRSPPEGLSHEGNGNGEHQEENGGPAAQPPIAPPRGDVINESEPEEEKGKYEQNSRYC